MQIQKGFVLEQQAEDVYILQIPENHPACGGTITMNATGAMLWRELELGTDLYGLRALLRNAFDVDESDAAAAVEAFLRPLRDAGCFVLK